jgi:hypothetical protein
MSEPYLKYPCGAIHRLKNAETVTNLLRSAHQRRDGSIRLVVQGLGATHPKLADGFAAACLFACGKRGPHRKVVISDQGPVVTCHCRVMQEVDGQAVDVTPARAGRCPHCVGRRETVEV